MLGLRIETAGQRNATTGKSEADLIGVENARQVRDLILERRDTLAAQERPQPIPNNDSALTLLLDIRDSLHRIESKLG